MAVAEAAAAIRAGEADRAVAVGHDTPFEPETLFHYHRLGLLSPETVRPFDRDRSGTVFGEGAASVMLETAADVQARHAAKPRGISRLRLRDRGHRAFSTSARTATA
jgi:3-oxoacyl-(acyl-carrier-protein) synthase